MKNSVCSLVLMILCVTLAVLVALFGFSAFNIGGVLEEDTISLGLDLVGGSSVTLKAIPEDGQELTGDDLNKAVDILRKRLDDGNYNEATIATVGTDKIRIEIPDVDDPEAAVNFLGATARLTFEDYEGNVIIEGKDVVGAEALYGPVSDAGISEWYVRLQLNEKAQSAFSEATDRISKLSGGNNYIAIMLDGETQSAPSVDKRIDQSECIISGNFTESSARELATLISAGQLPVSFEESELRSVDATLGSDALTTSLVAGFIGIALVIIFMIIVYRLPGFISGIALVAYTAIFAIVLSISKVNLSLPGIAGIILTIGMAVDSNVIIYERIKEELRIGKTLRAAVKAGFSRAFTAILDSNVTTIIASLVLWYYGTGSVQGFAKTLFIGVVISLFTALVVTRVLLNIFVELKVSPKLFASVAKKTEE